MQRFDGDQAGAMVLDARWTLLAGTDERFVATGRERYVEPAGDPASWDARVAALGRALAAFSGKVGEAVSLKTASRRFFVGALASKNLSGRSTVEAPVFDPGLHRSRDPAVDADVLAGDVGRPVGRQEGDRSRRSPRRLP